MGFFRPSREHRGPDPYYRWKAILFSIGSGFALAGMLTEHDWLVLVAIPILAVGVALRWLRRRQEAETETETETDGEPDEPEDR